MAAVLPDTLPKLETEELAAIVGTMETTSASKTADVNAAVKNRIRIAPLHVSLMNHSPRELGLTYSHICEFRSPPVLPQKRGRNEACR